MKDKKKAIIYGIFSIFVALFINFLVLFLLDFPLMAIQIISSYWILIILLISGFGLQVGLFIYFQGLIGYSTTILSGGLSSISMILCCSHYFITFLPIVGTFIGVSFLSGLAEYIVYFLLLGLVSNIIGLGIIFSKIKKHKEGDKNER